MLFLRNNKTAGSHFRVSRCKLLFYAINSGAGRCDRSSEALFTPQSPRYHHVSSMLYAIWCEEAMLTLSLMHGGSAGPCGQPHTQPGAEPEASCGKGSSHCPDAPGSCLPPPRLLPRMGREGKKPSRAGPGSSSRPRFISRRAAGCAGPAPPGALSGQAI